MKPTSPEFRSRSASNTLVSGILDIARLVFTAIVVAPDPAFAAAFGPDGWQQIPDTFTWVLPACNSTGCENADIFEPIGKWYFIPGGGWNPGTLGLKLFEADGTLSDIITVANDGPTGGATITFNSGNFGVPEPGTWTLMLIGFGGLGVALRSRRKVATA